MAVRALIIAIEDYDSLSSPGMEKTLPGALKAGPDFRDWLKAKWAVQKKTDTQILFCSNPVQPGGVSAGRADIIKALNQLKLGRDQTEERKIRSVVG